MILSTTLTSFPALSTSPVITALWAGQKIIPNKSLSRFQIQGWSFGWNTNSVLWKKKKEWTMCHFTDGETFTVSIHVNVCPSFKDPTVDHSPGSKCKPCPVVHPSPVCGTDGHTYSTKVFTQTHTITATVTTNKTQVTISFPVIEAHFLLLLPHSVSFCLSVVSVSWSIRHASQRRRSRWSAQACVPAPQSLNKALQRTKVRISTQKKKQQILLSRRVRLKFKNINCSHYIIKFRFISVHIKIL